jgi:pimeloyl-ACP methyl ester carboxylesterase
MPDAAGYGVPAPGMVLLGGTGGDTRDGEVNPALYPEGRAPPERGLLRKIAHRLAHAGVATLRFDKRGVGRSEGDFGSANYDTDLVDNVAAFRFLQEQPQIDGSRVGVAGHSAGAFNTCLVCRDVPEVACAGLLGALYSSIEDLVRFNWPRIAGNWTTFTDDQREWLLTNRPREVVLAFNGEAVIEAARQRVETVELEAFGLRLTYNTTRLRQDMERPVAAEFRHVRCPALVLHGGADLNVKVEDCLGTYQALKAAGNEAVDLVIVPMTEHSFCEVPLDPALRTWERVSLESWRRPTSRLALDVIASWAARVLEPA